MFAIVSHRLIAALGYAEIGRAVIALVPGQKIPVKDEELQPHGARSATRDPKRIRELWRRNPLANVAIVCGPVSGCAVADYDGPHAAGLAKRHGLIAPATWSVRTRRGWHFYIAYDPAIPSKAAILTADCGCMVDGKPKPCAIDARGDGGYAVAPPSLVMGHIYTVARDLPFAQPWPEFAGLCRSLTPSKPAPFAPRPAASGGSLISRIKAAWTIEEVADRLGVQLHGQGDQLKGRCPLHGESNGMAFVIWRGEQRWQCFGKCAIGGDVIDLFRAGQDRGLLA